MASWFRKRKKKAPEPIALVGLECGVDDEGDDEERIPLKTFSHRMGPDSPWEQYPAHQCLVIEEAMRARPPGCPSVRMCAGLVVCNPVSRSNSNWDAVYTRCGARRRGRTAPGSIG